MAVKLPTVMTSGYPGQIQVGDSIAWSWLSSTPTTLSGYGITDAAALAGAAFTGAVSMANGLSFGSTMVAGPTDLSKHIQLHGSGYGFSVTTATLNYVVPASTSHKWYADTTNIMTLTSAGALGVSGDISGAVLTCDRAVATGALAGYAFNDRTAGAQWTIYANSGTMRFYNGTDKVTVDVSGNATFAGTVTAGGVELGYRNIPMTVKNTAYTFTTADKGKGIVHTDTTARAYTVPTGFAQGDILTVANETGTGACTIVPGSGMTMYLAGTATTGTRTLAVRGIATIYIGTSGTSCYVSGPGVT